MKAVRKAPSPLPAPAPGSAGLRERAEVRLQRQPRAMPHTAPDLQRLVHELQVHQIELELQNEELQFARDERELALHKYADLYEFAPVGYVTLTPDGTVREANLAAARLLNVDRAQLIRRRLSVRVAAAQWADFTGFLARVFAGEGTESCEVKLWREGGSTAEMRIDAAPSEDGSECRAVFHDITVVKQTEMDRATISKLESTRILAGGLSHDFNNLLTVIVLNLDLAQTSDPADSRHAELLARAKDNAVLASSLIHQLMTFAHADAPVRKPIHLNALIRKFAAAEPAAFGRNDLALADGLWLTAGDEVQITEVLRNLVANAREAMPTGGVVSLRTENVQVDGGTGPLLSAGNYVLVSIADRGGGIAPEMRSRIFDPYFSTKIRATQRGMGLGLAICLAVVRGHDGTIVLGPAPEGGATFQIYLPALPAVARPHDAG